MDFYDSYEFVGGPLCGFEVALGPTPDGSNLFVNVPGGCHPVQIVIQTQYCFNLSERKLFFVSGICIRKALHKW